MTIRLIASTQYRENYAAHDWDGQGACPQGWKNKGGSDVLIAEWATIADVPKLDELDAMVDDARPVIERSDDYVEAFIIGTKILFDGELTSDEAMIDRMIREGYEPESARATFAPTPLAVLRARYQPTEAA